MSPKDPFLESSYKSFLKDLSLAIRNLNLYNQNHPAFINTLKDLKKDLEDILLKKDQINLGITPEGLLIDNDYFEKQNPLYKSIAKYLHRKMIGEIIFKRGLFLDEIKNFFEVISKNHQIKEQIPHILIKRIDYLRLLKPEILFKDISISDEELFKRLLDHFLEEPKEQLTIEILNSSLKLIQILNSVFKKDKSKIKDVVSLFSNLAKAIKENQDIEKKVSLRDFFNSFLDLDQNLLNLLFKEAGFQDILEIFGNYAEDKGISEIFLRLLISEGKMNERLLDLITRLCPQENRKVNVASIVSEEILTHQKIADLSGLKESISELFTSSPEDKFMSCFYKKTIDFFLKREKELAVSKRLESFYLKDLEKENIELHSFYLLLNLLDLERDFVTYKNLTNLISEYKISFLENLKFSILKEMISLFINHQEDQKRDLSIRDHSKKILEDTLSTNMAKFIISNLNRIKDVEREDAIFILIKIAENKGIDFLIDDFLKEEDRNIRDIFLKILGKFKEKALDLILPRLNIDLPWFVLKDTLSLFVSEDKAKFLKILKEFYFHPDLRVRIQAIKSLGNLATEEVIPFLFTALRDRENRIRRTALEEILRLNLPETIDKSIDILLNIKNPFYSRNRLLKENIRILGDLKVKESVFRLIRIFKKRSLLFKRRNDDLRLACLFSLAQIGTDEAIEMIKESLNDRSQEIRKFAESFISKRDESR